MIEPKDNINIWNECCIVYDLARYCTMKEVYEYMSQFSPEKRGEIGAMFSRIKREGYTKVKQELIEAYDNG